MKKVYFIKNIFVLLLFISFFITDVNSEENTNKQLPENCYVEYQVSPDAIACGFKKGFRKIYTKKDGSLNFLGKFFNAKTFTETLK